MLCLSCPQYPCADDYEVRLRTNQNTMLMTPHGKHYGVSEVTDASYFRSLHLHQASLSQAPEPATSAQV